MNTDIRYLIIGRGRLAKHMAAYLKQSHISYTTWNRTDDFSALETSVSNATHVLILISDAAIVPFYEKNLDGIQASCIHMSGTLQDDRIVGAHPMMTFASELYSLAEYQKIHFATSEAKSISEILPGLNNSSTFLTAGEKKAYHAWCVISGNFPQILWAEALKHFSALKIPAAALNLYLQKNLDNFKLAPETALTGPLVRNDMQTMQDNLKSLSPAHQELYLAFTKLKISQDEFTSLKESLK